MKRELLGYDRNGLPLREGDKVLSYNLMAPGETWPLSAPKQGVSCVLVLEGSLVYTNVIDRDSPNPGGTGVPELHGGKVAKVGYLVRID